MAHCIAFTRKGHKEPASFIDIDNAMWKHFNARPDDNWYRGWYNTIAMLLAAGMDYDKLRKEMPQYSDIIDWLDKNYTYKTWREW